MNCGFRPLSFLGSGAARLAIVGEVDGEPAHDLAGGGVDDLDVEAVD
jgi:hypothetical protein